ncbi:MAG TPA: hypothetical protein VFR11_18320 [Micromonosporaceae bacterium]|nr:hypothetical protein [Micromonosporaceae bacterium]
MASRDVNLNITATEETGPATAAAGRNIDQLQRKADGFNTKAAVRELNRLDVVIGKTSKDGGDGFEQLRNAISATEREIARLRTVFRETASVSVLGDLKTAKNDLGLLKRALVDVGEEGVRAFDVAGTKAATAFSSSMLDTLAEALPSLATNPVFLGAVAALTPVIVASLAGAVTAGVGLGVVAAGAAIEHNTPQIRAAFTGLVGTLERVGADAAAGLVGPIDDALAGLGEFVKAEGPQLRSLFDAVAPAVGLVEKEIEVLAANLLPALTLEARAFTQALSDPNVQGVLEAVAQVTADVFEQFASNTDLVKDGIILLAGIIGSAIGTFDLLVRIVSIADEAAHGLADALIAVDDAIHLRFAKAAADLRGQIEADAQAVGQFGAVLQGLPGTTQAAAGAFDALFTSLSNGASDANTKISQAFDSWLGGLLGVQEANLGTANSLATLKSDLDKTSKSVLEHGKAFSLSTEKGRENESALLGVVGAYKQQFDAAIAAGEGADKATEAYQKNIEGLRKTLTQAGLTKSQVDALTGSLDAVPPEVTASIAIEGLTDALNNLDDTIRQLNGLDGRHFTATIDIRGINSLNEALTGHAGGHGGGSVAFSQTPTLSASFARGGDGASSGSGFPSLPPAQIDVHNSLTASLSMDGREVARANWRHTSAERHAQRVGKLR